MPLDVLNYPGKPIPLGSEIVYSGTAPLNPFVGQIWIQPGSTSVLQVYNGTTWSGIYSDTLNSFLLMGA